MTLKMQFNTVLVLLVALSAPLAMAENTILQNIDDNTNRKDVDVSMVATMIKEDVDEGSDKRVVRMFRRDRADTFLMLFQQPSYKTGQGYLRIEDVLWFYDPESRKFSHQSMKDRFDGSSARNSDFKRSSLDNDYTVVTQVESQLGQYPVYILTLEAKHEEVTFPKKVLYVLKQPNLILKTQEYSLSDQLMRSVYFPSFTKSGDIYVATKRIFVDEVIIGNKTTFIYDQVSTALLSDSTFTKAYVERVNL